MNKSKAVFLDRDGVINLKKDDYVKKISELKIFPFTSNCIKKLREANFKIIVITNQSAINRGLMTNDDLKKIHDEIQRVLKKNGTKIDKFYHCPHTPSENCFCRKPRSDLLQRAIDDFSIDVNQSWLLGDSDSDILAGKAVKCKTVKINNERNLEHAVNLILKNN